MNNFWLDMALSVLFAALRDKQLLTKYERAFRKLYDTIGLAFNFNSDPPKPQTVLP